MSLVSSYPQSEARKDIYKAVKLAFIKLYFLEEMKLAS